MRSIFNLRLPLAFLLVILVVICSSIWYAKKGASHYEDEVAVLVYHHIDDQSQSEGTITPALFRDQLSYLKQQGYEFITFQQFKQFMEGGEVPDDAVLVTFDDGYASFYHHAYPILKSLSVPAVHFIITKDLDDPLKSRIPSLSKEQITEMTGNNDFIEVQSHTDKLHAKQSNKAHLTTRLTLVDKAEEESDYKERIVQDLRTSIEKLKPLQSFPIDGLAYPFGSYNRHAIELVKQAGIRYAFTVQPGITERDVDPYQIPRINAGGPWVTPDMLMETIQSQVMSFKEPLTSLPLRNIMEQLGGSVQRDADQRLNLYLGKERWTLISKTEAVNLNGQQVTLSRPLTTEKKRTCIDYADLQKLFGSSMAYNPNTKRFLLKTAMAYDE